MLPIISNDGGGKGPSQGPLLIPTGSVTQEDATSSHEEEEEEEDELLPVPIQSIDMLPGRQNAAICIDLHHSVVMSFSLEDNARGSAAACGPSVLRAAPNRGEAAAAAPAIAGASQLPELMLTRVVASCDNVDLDVLVRETEPSDIRKPWLPDAMASNNEGPAIASLSGDTAGLSEIPPVSISMPLSPEGYHSTASPLVQHQPPSPRPAASSSGSTLSVVSPCRRWVPVGYGGYRPVLREGEEWGSSQKSELQQGQDAVQQPSEQGPVPLPQPLEQQLVQGTADASELLEEVQEQRPSGEHRMQTDDARGPAEPLAELQLVLELLPVPEPSSEPSEELQPAPELSTEPSVELFLETFQELMVLSAGDAEKAASFAPPQPGKALPTFTHTLGGAAEEEGAEGRSDGEEGGKRRKE